MDGVEEEEDDLGYYPDGVKRTLTDEQIAMFRNSEIYSLLRKRQVQEENREADQGSRAVSGPLRPDSESLDNRLEDWESHAARQKDDGVDEASNAGMKKQKLNGEKVIRHPQALLSRRQIRELDSGIQGINHLDYGDEPGVGPSEEKTAALDSSSQTQINHATHEEQNDERSSRGAGSPKQGKKIWWPKIG